jgi:hypothetical protein
MAVPLVLLPLLFAGAAPKIVASGDHPRIEQALSDGVRARVAAGWAVLDLRTVNDEFVVTVRKADAIEKHIVHFDRKNVYRIEQAASAPADANEPSDFVRQALAAPRGGIELMASCGGYYERAYVIDDEATGEFATTLVARALATTDDVAGASSRHGHVVFSLQKKNLQRDLVVWVDPKGTVIEAQLRRFEHGGGGPNYKRTAELKRAMTKTRVISVVDHGATLALVTPSGKFVIDPNGASFDHGEGEYEGCGC